MIGDHRQLCRAFGGLAVACVILGFAAVACSNIHPEPDVEEGGLLESPTHEADAARREADRSRGGGGGGSY
jgi:hypothetical protein